MNSYIHPESGLFTPGSEQNSHDSCCTQENDLLSVSTAFFPGVDHTPSNPDLILMSSEDVFFYVHSYRILPSSNNAFGHLWPPRNIERQPPLVMLPESSAVLNIVLHVAYRLPFSKYACSDEVLIQSIDALHKYGFSLYIHVSPSSELYRLLISRRTLTPINLYALAAKYDLNELATEISTRLLAYDLSNLTDDLVRDMGAIYLRRLFFLHLRRVDTLKRLLLPPAAAYHYPSAICGAKEHADLIRAWGLAVSSMIWSIGPATEPIAVVAALAPVTRSVHCSICRAGVDMTVQNIAMRWANVKVVEQLLWSLVAMLIV